jgi:hypothetical protein
MCEKWEEKKRANAIEQEQRVETNRKWQVKRFNKCIMWEKKGKHCVRGKKNLRIKVGRKT